MTAENEKQVLIELRVPRNMDRGEILAQVADKFQLPGLTIDTNYAPVPVKPSREDALQLGKEETVVIIRGTVAAGQEAGLRQHPQVLNFWDDTPTSPMDSETEPPADLGFD